MHILCTKNDAYIISCTYISTVIYLELNASIDALVLVNTTVAQLVTLTQRLQIELNVITTQTTILKTTCSATPGVLLTICDMIPTTSYAVTVDYSAVSVYLIVCACVCVCVCVCVLGPKRTWITRVRTFVS